MWEERPGLLSLLRIQKSKQSEAEDDPGTDIIVRISEKYLLTREIALRAIGEFIISRLAQAKIVSKSEVIDVDILTG